MCGIAGVFNWGDVQDLERMTEVQRHRGPDDGGVWHTRLPNGDYVGLGNRRLAILDLSSAGHMPMASEDESLWITYNGEIYNFPELKAELRAKGHVFRSGTDTEVVLRLYQEEGPRCVDRLNGMFAFAIWDHRRHALFLARDPFGVKPLYYAVQGSRFAFASEIKALLELPGVPRTVDLEALHQYLTFLWVPDPDTAFQGIRKLPAGHYALYQGGALQQTQYWDLTYPPADHRYALALPELIEEVRGRFRRSVEQQMISDVPIGAFLSSGIDSTSIVASMAADGGEPVRTFTISYPPQYRVGEMTVDDPGIARRVAQRFHCDHHEILAEPEAAELLPKLTWHMDEPVGDPAIMMAYLVCRATRPGAKVLLSGIGGDELFAGYRRHYAYYWGRAYRHLPSPLRRHVIESGVGRLPVMRGTPFKGAVRLAKKMARSASLTPQDAFLTNLTYLDGTHLTQLYAPEMMAHLAGKDPWQRHRAFFREVHGADFLNQMLYLDAKTFMVSLNLTYNDKMSMASSVEVRVPFLDKGLAEFVAWHVPPRFKVNGFLRPTTKYVFRKAMEGILPQEVLRRPKAFFGAPVDYWLSYDLREMVDDLLSMERVRQRGYFQPAAVRRLVDEHRSGREDWSMQIWQLLTLEIWLQVFMDGGVRDRESQPAGSTP